MIGVNRPLELLSPAGDMQRLKYALAYGADAVYLAGQQFGMRSGPSNFTFEELKAACDLAHEKGKKIYLTCNTLPRNSEAAQLPDFLKNACRCGVDAFIIADVGTLMLAKKHCPDVPVHISTQAGIVNYETARAFYEMGASRIVTARELSLNEIREIRDKTPPELEIEAFVHGAMCMSFSGRCILSDYLTNRDANRGDCAQPCRWKYYVMEESRPGRYFPVCEDEKGTYLFNSRDLCMLEHLPELDAAGIDSFKIEGRAKSEYYYGGCHFCLPQCARRVFAKPFSRFSAGAVDGAGTAENEPPPVYDRFLFRPNERWTNAERRWLYPHLGRCCALCFFLRRPCHRLPAQPFF